MTRIRVAVIIKRDDEILLAKHVKNGREYWVIPGGGIEPGETLAEAGEREIKEETGLEVSVEKLVFVGEIIPPEGGGRVVDFFFSGRALSGRLRRGTDKNLADLRYFPVEEVNSLEFYPCISDELIKAVRGNFEGPGLYLGNRLKPVKKG